MNKNYLNILYGLLLGESSIINNNNKFKLIIKIEDKHIYYIKEVHKKISKLGYCEPTFPKIMTKLRKKGKINKLMLLQTYYNNNYLELYNKWYFNKVNKVIPKDIIYYFNEESLAY